jgi:hypothetical protein
VSVAGSLSVFFAAGALGAFANSLVAWSLGELGVARALGVAIQPELSPAWLYPRLVWGGLWGGLFVLPLSSQAWLRRGLILSLGPTLVQLLVVFPARGAGVLGLGLGVVTPLFVLILNGVWGLVASWWVASVRGS